MADRASGASEAPRPKPRRARRVWLRTGEIILLAVAAFCLVVLVTQDLSLVTGLLYSPLAIVLLVVVFVEYLIIKGGDRSRLYLLELERMHEREQEHVAQTRRALEEIRGALESCRASAAPDEKSDSAEIQPADVERSLKRVEQILQLDVKE